MSSITMYRMFISFIFIQCLFPSYLYNEFNVVKPLWFDCNSSNTKILLNCGDGCLIHLNPNKLFIFNTANFMQLSVVNGQIMQNQNLVYLWELTVL